MYILKCILEGCEVLQSSLSLAALNYMTRRLLLLRSCPIATYCTGHRLPLKTALHYPLKFTQNLKSAFLNSWVQRGPLQSSIYHLWWVQGKGRCEFPGIPRCNLTPTCDGHPGVSCALRYPSTKAGSSIQAPRVHCSCRCLQRGKIPFYLANRHRDLKKKVLQSLVYKSAIMNSKQRFLDFRFNDGF